MSRNIIMSLPALAFVLPMFSTSPALAYGGGQKQTQEQEQGPGYDQTQEQEQGQGQGQGYDQTQEQQGGGHDEGGSLEIGLAFCTMVEVVAKNRDCELVDTEQNIARCAVRYLPGKEHGYKPSKPGKGGHDDEGSLIFVKLEQCTALGVNIDLNR